MKQAVWLLVVLLLALPACQMFSGKTGGPGPVVELDGTDSLESSSAAPLLPAPGLRLSPAQRFKDIPLPVGLNEDMERTYVYESPSLQIGRMVYTSREGVADLTQFFIRECPTGGWKLQNVIEAETKTLLFTKPDKRLEVSVQNLGLTRGRRVVITLSPATDGTGGL